MVLLALALSLVGWICLKMTRVPLMLSRGLPVMTDFGAVGSLIELCAVIGRCCSTAPDEKLALLGDGFAEAEANDVISFDATDGGGGGRFRPLVVEKGRLIEF